MGGWTATTENSGLKCRARRGPGQDYRTGVLIDLHARTIALVREVLVLLQQGLADAAMARWRTLHESAVVAVFLSENSNDVAERFRLHEVVESFRAAHEHERHRESLGYEPIDPDELEDLTRQHKALLARFGKPFETPYGWAAEALSKTRPTFADIEAAARLDHLRPYYRLASHPVHANPKALTFSLAWNAESRLRAYAPSNSGFVDPAQSALISLARVTVALLSSAPEPEQAHWRPRYDALAGLIDTAIDTFVGVQADLDEEEALVREGRLPTVEESRPPGLRVRVAIALRVALRRVDDWVVEALLSE